jgi:hypothetical protein
MDFDPDGPDGDPLDDGPDDPDLDRFVGLCWLANQGIDTSDEIAELTRQHAAEDVIFWEMATANGMAPPDKVTVVTFPDGRPEAVERRRAAAGVHHQDTVTRTIHHPDGRIEFDGDPRGGLPTVWDQ